MGRDNILVRGDLSKYWLVGGDPPSPPPTRGNPAPQILNPPPCFQHLWQTQSPGPRVFYPPPPQGYNEALFLLSSYFVIDYDFE